MLFLVKVSEPKVHVQGILGVQCTCEMQNRKTTVTVPFFSLEVFLWPDVLAFSPYEITAPS